MDVAAEVVHLAQRLGHQRQLLLRVVGVSDHAGGEEQALDVVALVDVQRQPHHLFDGEAGAGHVGADAVDAVGAVEHAEVGQQDLEQAHAPTVGRVGMAHAHAARRGAHAPPVARVALGPARRGATGVVLRRVRQDRQLLAQVQRDHRGTLVFHLRSVQQLGALSSGAERP